MSGNHSLEPKFSKFFWPF